MHPLAAGEARGLTRRARFCALALVAALMPRCAPHDVRAAATAEDAAYRTGAFTWLVDHDPSTLVAWRIAPDRLRALVPDSTVRGAVSDRPCEQARRSHAALFVVADRSHEAVRSYALDCGVSLFRDDGAIVVAPSP